MRRSFALLAAALLCAVALAGCVQSQPTGTGPTQTGPVQTANSALAVGPEYAIQRLSIDENGIGDFVIVTAGGTHSASALLVQEAVAAATGHTLEILTPNGVPEGGHAIAFASSGYGKSGEYTVDGETYGIFSDGTDVYICGGDEMMEAYGAKQFVYTVLGYNTKLGTAENAEVSLGQLNVTGERAPTVIDGDQEYLTRSTMILEINEPFPEKLTYNTQQGSCSDGRYAYFCLLDKATETGGCAIFKYDMTDWSLVKANYNVQVGHGNTVCYVDKLNQLMVVDYSSSMEVHFVNVDTLEVVGSRMLPFEFYAATYEPSLDRYVFGVKAAKKFYILDGDFQLLKFCDIDTTAGDQGVYCDENYIYFVYYNPNTIEIFDWDCNHVNTIRMDTTLEVESMFVENGVYYFAYYISPGLGGQLYTMDIF